MRNVDITASSDLRQCIEIDSRVTFCQVTNHPRETTSLGGTTICLKRTINSEQQYFDYDANGSVTVGNPTLGKKSLLSEVMIYGDFNFPTIVWNSLSTIHLENNFLEHMELHTLHIGSKFSHG